ncbi:hypothetical protein H9X85_11860 [Anaerotignum lactatifermentans]|uniref:SLH domain-containing protein n=1 Tax=Anaerotignum lactatifermentans TaxID=160404 RepID=A0ABS2GBJ2_9FIRM|nr:hypothetical protein [Anaerotignum lactatifermentans]MBM6830324.1 hypothetical protein [Anaerotignum lactatifermentans]MBM6878849.1 hypothetical protein [Anaerotignum lactatifermentans]MBM6951885.1 hypothetical protein [Anaerotignum lactatifermentans]
MKKLTTSLLICMLVLGAAACGTDTQKEEASTDQEISGELTAEQKEEISHMTAPIDAVTRCMLENNMEYDPSDPAFFWTSLSYFVGAYGQNHTSAELTDSTITLPRKAVQEHAIALFADYDDLLPLPEELSDRVTYDESMDAYTFSLGDIGLCTTELSDERMEDGVLTLQANLLSTMNDSTIGTWTVTLTENTYADGITDPIYLYSLSSVTPLEITRTISAVYNGLSDGHTAEMTLSDGTVEAFQFSGDDLLEQLNSFQSGDAITFTCKQTGTDGPAVITAIQ